MPSVEALTRTVRDVLNDPDGDIYSNQLIHDAIYNGEVVIAANRFDSTAVYREFFCSAGTRQRLSDSQAVISVERNGTQAQPGKAIRLVSKQDLDTFDEDWHMRAPAVPNEYALDDRDPLTFYVSPPAPAGHSLMLTESVIPTVYGIVDRNTMTTVGENFRQALIEFALYLCFANDTEGTPNISRSQQHLNTFSNMLGLNWQSIKGASAKNPDNKR